MRREEVELDDMRSADEDVDANEPLIAEHTEVEQQKRDENRSGALDGPAKPSIRSAGKIIWLLTFSAGISGLLFGYDTGVISSTLVSVGSDLSHRPLTVTDQSLITAITSLFALLSAPLTGYLADRYGRRFVILLANLFFIAGAIVQASAGYVYIMVIGRAAVGTAVGLASCATPLYITELAPAEMRGRLVTVQSLFITGGQAVAYLIGWGLAHLPAGWRYMVGLGAVPAVLQLFLLALMFETPRWLVKSEQHRRARAVLQRVYGGLPERERQITVESVLACIQAEIADEGKLDDFTSEHGNNVPPGTFWSTVKHLVLVPGNRRALTIACTLQCLQQLCGFNSLMYFSATIFALVGFTSPIGTSLSVALTNFIFTIAAFKFIDTVGRRNILLRSIPFMAVGLFTCSFAFHFINISRSGADQATSWDMYHAKFSAWPTVLLISMIIYVAAYAIGLGCVPWQQSELFPLQVRSLGSGIATATNWSSNFVIGTSFLPMMEFLGPSLTFSLYAIICCVGWIGVWTIYPETAGLELEEVGELLKSGWGVEESLERFAARKNG